MTTLRIAQYRRDYRVKNQDKLRQGGREYYAKNREKLRQKNREYYTKNQPRLRQANKGRYQQNKTNILSKNYARVRANRDWMRAVKAAAGCLDCGIVDPDVLEFDHREPQEKTFNVGSSSGVGTSRARLEAEIAKCDVRCANCHRKRTLRLRHSRTRRTGSNQKDSLELS